MMLRKFYIVFVLLVSFVVTSSVYAQQPPPAFSKQSPPNGATNVGTVATLKWNSVPGTQKYCVSTTPNACPGGEAGYKTVSTNSVIVTLLPNTTYYWQVRVYNGTVYTPANGVAGWWMLRTMPDVNKLSPLSGSVINPPSVTLRWSSIPSNTSARYCLSSVNGQCPGGETGYRTVFGSGTSVTVAITPSTVYFWQVRVYDVWGDYTPADGVATWFKFSVTSTLH